MSIKAEQGTGASLPSKGSVLAIFIVILLVILLMLSPRDIRNSSTFTGPLGNVFLAPQRLTPYGVNQSKLGPVINPHNFEFLIDPPGICNGQDELLLIAYVLSAPGNILQRNSVRRTWGNVSQYDYPVAVVFALGMPRDQAALQHLQTESMTFGDIMLENFTDNYKNLPIKSISALKWISEHCDKAVFVLKTDDDIFVNFYPMLKHLHDLYVAGVTSRLLMCKVDYNKTVRRSGRYAVSTKSYRNKTIPYKCWGSGYVMTTDVAKALYVASWHTTPIHNEDGYITGIIAHNIGIEPVSFLGRIGRRKLRPTILGPDWYSKIFYHNFGKPMSEDAWRLSIQQFNNKTIPNFSDIIRKQMSS